jgi:hypothetical protein
LEGAEFEVDPAADFDLGNGHRRKPEPADLASRDESLGFDGDVVLANPILIDQHVPKPRK